MPLSMVLEFKCCNHVPSPFSSFSDLPRPSLRRHWMELIARIGDNAICWWQVVEMEATNAELEDNNTRLEAAAMRAAEQAAELASLRAALKAREQQHLALKVRCHVTPPFRRDDGSSATPCACLRRHIAAWALPTCRHEGR